MNLHFSILPYAYLPPFLPPLPPPTKDNKMALPTRNESKHSGTHWGTRNGWYAQSFNTFLVNVQCVAGISSQISLMQNANWMTQQSPLYSILKSSVFLVVLPPYHTVIHKIIFSHKRWAYVAPMSETTNRVRWGEDYREDLIIESISHKRWAYVERIKHTQ